MRFLKTNTATRVTVGPFLDVTDAITPETALTVTGCHMTLCVDSAGVPTLAADVDLTASAGDNDMVHITGDDAGFYDLELTAAQLNYVGRAILAIVDTDVHLPVFHEFMLVPAMVYDSIVAGTDTLQADVTQYNGTAGTFASGRPEVNTSHIAGSAVSTTTAQIGANVVQTAAYGFTTGAVVDDALNSATTFETNLTASANDHHNDAYLLFTSGTLAGQVRKITDYDGTTKFVTCDAFTAEPTAADAFVIVNR